MVLAQVKRKKLETFEGAENDKQLKNGATNGTTDFSQHTFEGLFWFFFLSSSFSEKEKISRIDSFLKFNSVVYEQPTNMKLFI